MAPNNIPDMRDPAVLELVLCLLEVDPIKSTETKEKDNEKEKNNDKIMNKMIKNPINGQSVIFKTSTFEHKGTDYHADWLPLTSIVDRTFSPALVTIPIDGAINEVQLKHMLSEMKGKSEIPAQTRVPVIAAEQQPNLHRRSFLGKILPEFSYGTFTAKTNEHYKMSGKMYYDFKDSASSSKRKDKLLLPFSTSLDGVGNTQDGFIGIRQSLPFGKINNEYQGKDMSHIDFNLMSIEEGEKEKDRSNDDNILQGHSDQLMLLPATYSTSLPLSVSDATDRQTIISRDCPRINSGSNNGDNFGSSNRGNHHCNDIIDEQDNKIVMVGSLATSLRSLHSRAFNQRHQHQQSQPSETNYHTNSTGQDEYGNNMNHIRMFSHNDNGVETVNSRLYLDDYDSRQLSDTDGIKISMSNTNVMNIGGKRVIDMESSGATPNVPVMSSQVWCEIDLSFIFNLMNDFS